ncbi:MAG: DUF4920 domain-containing protein, partial [Planctomycetes bacterium]|nr:DUF4920 domain-containing protein [Planctomycetota bacterium]
KKADCGGCIDKQMQAASPATKADTSKGMKLKETTPISEILAAFEKFEGKRVLVKGIALGTCAKRGCWVNLKSEKDNKSFLRVKVEDGEIVFPMTVVGKEVQVEGIVEKMVIPVETLREQGQKTAEAKGEKFDPASIKEPRIVWQLKGLGAKWDKSADKAEKTEKADKADKVDRDAGR